MFLSKMVEADRKASALLVDLISLVDDPHVAGDEEFVKLLEDAFNHAEKKVANCKAEKLDDGRPREAPEKPRETSSP